MIPTNSGLTVGSLAAQTAFFLLYWGGKKGSGQMTSISW